jgi:hypothetical protein
MLATIQFATAEGTYNLCQAPDTVGIVLGDAEITTVNTSLVALLPLFKHAGQEHSDRHKRTAGIKQ